MHPFGGMDGNPNSGGQIISGGQIMAWMDLCGGTNHLIHLKWSLILLDIGIAAKRHCRQSVVTASFDELHFGVGATVICGI